MRGLYDMFTGIDQLLDWLPGQVGGSSVRSTISVATIAAGLGVVALGPALLTIASAATPDHDRPVLVIVAPWQNGASIVEAAGGRSLGITGAPMGVLARFTDPGFIARLSDAGAWAVLDGGALAEICGVELI
jgi:hypothetical protein